MKKIILLAILVVVAVYFFVRKSDNSDNIIDDELTYTKPWRDPNGSEFKEIGRLMVSKGIRDCGEFYVKEIAFKEYVIACTKDGKNWNYYVAWLNIEDILQANDEMIAKLKAPKIYE